MCVKKSIILISLRRNGKKKKSYRRSGRRKVNKVETETFSDSESENIECESSSNELYVQSIRKVGSVSSVKKPLLWLKKIIVEGHKVTFKLDTGCEVSILTLNIVKKLGLLDKMQKSKVKLALYGIRDYVFAPLGEITLKCQVNDNVRNIFFAVCDNNELPLLSCADCIDLNLVKRVDSIVDDSGQFISLDHVVKRYPVVFEGLGSFPREHHITLKEGTVSVVQPLRRIPIALHDCLKLKLDDLEKQGIIRKIDRPTEWLNPLVIVEKKNKDLRLCLDPKYLNLAIKQERFLILSTEVIAVKLNNKEYFSFRYERRVLSNSN
ncbi:uncharacterized protein LOC130447174 [Diorhabda sublineata]|uniref:uncharacterized protein LOC130447174 n=1 Tax=Diorhabda sublineata TaxID=1163346 RepID=UPI0024E16B75|nr:uncharacterized protein LOC130447174 [Diorhabda sublineata]